MGRGPARLVNRADDPLLRQNQNAFACVDSGDMDTQPPEDAGRPVGRRVVLGVLGLGAAGVAFGPAVSRGLGAVSGALSRHDPTGLSSYIPGAGWRYYTVTNSFPYQPPSSYRLSVSGNVANEDRQVQSALTERDTRDPPGEIFSLFHLARIDARAHKLRQ